MVSVCLHRLLLIFLLGFQLLASADSLGQKQSKRSSFHGNATARAEAPASSLGLDPPPSSLHPTLLALQQRCLCQGPEEIDPELQVSLGDTLFSL